MVPIVFISHVHHTGRLFSTSSMFSFFSLVGLLPLSMGSSEMRGAHRSALPHRRLCQRREQPPDHLLHDTHLPTTRGGSVSGGSAVLVVRVCAVLVVATAVEFVRRWFGAGRVR